MWARGDMSISPGWRVEEYLIQLYPSIFSVRLYLGFPNKKPMGTRYPSPKHHPHTPSVPALILAMAGTGQLPTSSTQ